MLPSAVCKGCFLRQTPAITVGVWKSLTRFCLETDSSRRWSSSAAGHSEGESFKEFIQGRVSKGQGASTKSQPGSSAEENANTDLEASSALDTLKHYIPEDSFPTRSPISIWEKAPEVLAAREKFLSKLLAVPQQQKKQNRQVGTEEERPQIEALADPETGYAALGGYVPSRPNAFFDEKPLRLHPTKTFYPGMRYEPQELAVPSAGGRRPFIQRGPWFTNEEAVQQADFKNLSFLNRFVTDTGRLIARRQTKLRQKVHRHVARQVKLARQLALLPFTNRRPEFVRRRVPPEARMQTRWEGGFGGASQFQFAASNSPT